MLSIILGSVLVSAYLIVVGTAVATVVEAPSFERKTSQFDLQIDHGHTTTVIQVKEAPKVIRIDPKIAYIRLQALKGIKA